jgi:hypothetical protein
MSYALPLLTGALGVTSLVLMFGSDQSPFVFESEWYHYRPLNRVKIGTYDGPMLIQYLNTRHVLPEGFILSTTPSGASVRPRDGERTTYTFWPSYIQVPHWERDQSGLEYQGGRQFKWTEHEKEIYRKLTGKTAPTTSPLVYWKFKKDGCVDLEGGQFTTQC